MSQNIYKTKAIFS